MKPIAPLIIATFVAVASPAIAQQPKVQSVESFASAPGRGEATRAVRVSATVTAIDKATIVAENTTVRPAVAMATTSASSRSAPPASSSRYRLMISSV